RRSSDLVRKLRSQSSILSAVWRNYSHALAPECVGRQFCLRFDWEHPLVETSHHVGNNRAFEWILDPSRRSVMHQDDDWIQRIENDPLPFKEPVFPVLTQLELLICYVRGGIEAVSIKLALAEFSE